eukprot:2834085-Rhodomonas_salina.1
MAAGPPGPTLSPHASPLSRAVLTSAQYCELAPSGYAIGCAVLRQGRAVPGAGYAATFHLCGYVRRECPLPSYALPTQCVVLRWAILLWGCYAMRRTGCHGPAM